MLNLSVDFKWRSLVSIERQGEGIKPSILCMELGSGQDVKKLQNSLKTSDRGLQENTQRFTNRNLTLYLVVFIQILFRRFYCVGSQALYLLNNIDASSIRSLCLPRPGDVQRHTYSRMVLTNFISSIQS